MLSVAPNPVLLAPLAEPQLCYALLTAGAQGVGKRPVNWAIVADASRSMRIPIVDEAQFRALLSAGGAQETLVDGVPVWQLSGPVPAQVRAAAPNALDHVARALHALVERLDAQDHFTLIACAEEALPLALGIGGRDRETLVRAINRLSGLSLGDETNLARGLALALSELRSRRDGRAAGRVLLLTDGFTREPEVCLRLAAEAAADRVAISTIGLGSEFQEDVLTALADRSGGRAVFVRHAQDVPQAVDHELEAARASAASGVTLSLHPAPGVLLRRVTQIRPALTVLFEHDDPGTSHSIEGLHLADLPAGTVATLLMELLAPPGTAGELCRVALTSASAPPAAASLAAYIRSHPPDLPAEVHAAAARASVARLHRRAQRVIAGGDLAEGARLLRAASARFGELGEMALAAAAREHAETLERGVRPSPVATKELTYRTRRLGER